MILEEAKCHGSFEEYWATFQKVYSVDDEKDPKEEVLQIQGLFKEQLDKCHEIEDELL